MCKLNKNLLNISGSWQGVASAPVSVGKTVLDKGQMVGEALHNLQPLIHCILVELLLLL